MLFYETKLCKLPLSSNLGRPRNVRNFISVNERTSSLLSTTRMVSLCGYKSRIDVADDDRSDFEYGNEIESFSN